MSLYIFRDIKVQEDGDFELQNGDVSLANPYETQKAAANFILRTDKGGYAPNQKIGANLGTFIGQKNDEESHVLMEYSIRESLSDRVFSRDDIDVSVVPFDVEEALCIVRLAGSFEVSGEIKTVNNDIMTYTFPYIEGNPTPITI